MVNANPDKQLLIDGKRMLHGTSIKPSPETSDSTTKTFDGSIVQGSKDIPWTIDVSKVRYDNQTTHRELSEKLEEMLEVPKMVTVREVVRPAGEDPYVIVDNFFECIVTGNDYEVKPDDHTVENLKFKASRRERKYDNV